MKINGKEWPVPHLMDLRAEEGEPPGGKVSVSLPEHKNKPTILELIGVFESNSLEIEIFPRGGNVPLVVASRVEARAYERELGADFRCVLRFAMVAVNLQADLAADG